MQTTKELLVYSITIRLADSCNIPTEKLKEIIEKELSEYYVERIETTIPSVGDGSSTKLLMEKFIKAKSAEGMQKRSLEEYTLTVKQLCAYANKDLNMIQPDDIEGYINDLRKRNLKDTTIKGYYLNLSSIFRYLYDRHYIGSNPCAFMKTPKETVKLKKPLTEQEIERIRVACEQLDSEIKRKRGIALFNFMLDTGARVSEVASIKLKDVDFRDNSIVILGKGHKEREIIFSDRTYIRLQAYLATRKDIVFETDGMKYDVDTPLFASINYPYGPLSKSGIEVEMKKIGELSGVPRLHPHLIRATFATNLAIAGTPLNVIADLLGHSNYNTINRYVLIPKAKMRELTRKVA